jgi:cyclopropane-fatty-acyl-phospholipid synthase
MGSRRNSYRFAAKSAAADVVGATARATIRVTSDKFWLRLLTLGDLGFAEAYMAGECEVARDTDEDGVVDLGEGLLDVFKVGVGFSGGRPSQRSITDPSLARLQILIHSQAQSEAPTSTSPSRTRTVGAINTLPSALFMKVAAYAADSRVVNSVRNSVGNIRAHYDISNRMFASFLSRDVRQIGAAVVGRVGVDVSDIPPPNR